ncbi:MAG: hypothetical protein GX879_01405 [Bacteroidales bacterium]|nr:hypothetical protein [Bacteroidales bacterium]
MRFLSLLFSFVFAFSLLNAQDTVRILTYNLLYYNHYGQDWCTEENNPINNKDQWLRTIISYTKPDIVAFNEVAGNEITKYKLKGSVLNTDGRTYFKETNYPYGAGNLTCFMYYNQEKFDLKEVFDVYTASSRDFKVYRLQYKHSLSETNLYIIPVHFAAGNNTSGQNKRAQMADSIMSLVERRGNNDNFIVLGDMNVYRHTEPAFQKLINHPNIEYRFYDPVNQLGSWNNNPSFKNYHTQSTHTDDDGCKATGGLDDRFDIILVDDDILSGAGRVKYIENSYTTVGQDGEHFNHSLIVGGNSSVPADVLNALYNMSDHLPVYADFVIGNANSSEIYSFENVKINYQNPINLELKVEILSPEYDYYELSLVTSMGVVLETTGDFIANSGSFVFNTETISKGVYHLIVSNSKGFTTKKILKL